jgi:hypothetical protein
LSEKGHAFIMTYGSQRARPQIGTGSPECVE